MLSLHYETIMVAGDGFEPSTFRLWAWRANRAALSRNNLAGLVGFEPTHTRVKVLCLTTWRQPNKMVGMLGIEPRQELSQSSVLPLHHTPHEMILNKRDLSISRFRKLFSENKSLTHFINIWCFTKESNLWHLH